MGLQVRIRAIITTHALDRLESIPTHAGGVAAIPGGGGHAALGVAQADLALGALGGPRPLAVRPAPLGLEQHHLGGNGGATRVQIIGEE